MNMKKALGARFVAVSEELETCYPKELLKDTDYKDWLEGSFADYLNKKNIPKEDRGKLKSNLAKIIGDTITPQQFKDKFKELHDCIFLR